jgi:FKBP-type peptidyl-prolyl cis-trans isomerase FkpA
MRANALAMLSVVGLLTGLSFLETAVAAPKATPSVAAAPVIPDTEEARTLYALGLVLGRNISSFGLTPSELVTVKAGLDAAVLGGKPAVDLAVYGPKLQAFQAGRAHAIAEREEASGAAYLENAAQAAGAIRTPSGAVYQVLTPGDGPSPTASDRVKVQYEGRLIDGTVFDSSKAHGDAATMALSGVIPCWSEAVPLMKVGGRSRIVCPAKLAYGDRGSGPTIRPGATLVFDIDLIAIAPQ